MREIRYAMRSLLRTPAFTIATVLTLAIGIGAATAIYSLVDTILFRPLPFPGGDRLVRLVEYGRTSARDNRRFSAGLTTRSITAGAIAPGRSRVGPPSSPCRSGW